MPLARCAAPEDAHPAPEVPTPVEGKVMTASMVFDGETVEIRYGPGQDFESPADFFSPCSRLWREPYHAMLDFLADSGWLDALPLDAGGALSVGLPFCGSVQEVPELAAFLSERFLGGPCAAVSILGTDVQDWDRKGGYWRQKEGYVARKYGPRMRLQFRVLDLTAESHPPCALTLGLHPECTLPDVAWRKILANVVQGTLGTCVIATFKEAEMEVVREVCQELGAAFEVHDNPYWIGRPLPEGTIPPYLRYLILVRCPVQARATT